MMSRRRVEQRALLVFAVALLAPGSWSGCDRMPDASAATRSFGAHRAEAEAVEQALRAALRELPDEVRCADPATVVASQDLAAAAEFERCQEAHRAQLDAERAVWVRLRTETLPGLLDAHPSLLGAEITVGSSSASVGTMGPSNVGTPAGEGTAVDGYELGWSLYQTAFEATPPGETTPLRVGDGEARPGLEITRSITERERVAQVRIVFLMEGQTDPEWRAAHRRIAGP